MRISTDMVKSRFVQVLLCLSLLSPSMASVLLPDTPVFAAPDRLLWTTIRTPSDDDFMVVTPSEVNVLVPASDSIWYAADIPNLVLYKSEDGGLTWQDDILDNLLDAEPTPVLPVWDLAVAPDDPDFVVAVTDERQQVYVSEDGGETWDHASSGAGWSSAELIADISVSGEYDGVRDIAVGTRDAISGAYGDVWAVTPEVWGVWSEQELDMDVSTVRFSPDYDADETIVAIGSVWVWAHANAAAKIAKLHGVAKTAAKKPIATVPAQPLWLPVRLVTEAGIPILKTPNINKPSTTISRVKNIRKA